MRWVFLGPRSLCQWGWHESFYNYCNSQWGDSTYYLLGEILNSLSSSSYPISLYFYFYFFPLPYTLSLVPLLET